VNNPSKITRLSIGLDDAEPFSFLGIVTSEADYTLSLLINKKTRITLRHSDEEIVPDSANEGVSFSLFVTPSHSHALVSNKTEKNILINKLNKIDFLFIVSKEKSSNIPDLAKRIRSIEGVTAVFVFNSAEIKDRNINLIRHLSD
jgi:hypothetical protein